jgi:predicted transcriptional regulator
MNEKKLKPTEAELEILQVLWEKGPCPVKQVNDELNLRKPVGYTTTLKIMQIMTDKGLLERSRDGRNHIYYPLIKKEDTQQQMLSRLLHNMFGGSAKNLVMQALGNHQPTAGELAEIKKFIDQLENGKK